MISKLISSISSPVNRVKILKHSKALGAFGSTQILIQLVGMVSGIIIVRWLPPDQYALYTLALTILGTMSILADGGIASGVMAEGGKVWQNRAKLGSVIATGLALRKKFAVVSILISLPILIYLLLSHGANWITASLIILGVMVMFLTSLSGTLLEIAPKLHQSIIPLSKLYAIQALARLILITTAIKLLPISGIAILASSLPQCWGNWKLRKITFHIADKSQQIDSEVSKRIIKIVRRSLPESAFYCLSAQLSIWMLALIGTTHSIAQLGALGRINQIFALLTIFTTMILVPRFARLPENRATLFRLLLGSTILILAVGLLVTLGSYFLAPQILSLLGGSYRDLEGELVLVTLGASVGILLSLFYNFAHARGWIIRPSIVIFTELSSKLFFLYIVDVSSLRGVIIFSVLSTLPTLLIRALYIFWKINTSKSLELSDPNLSKILT